MELSLLINFYKGGMLSLQETMKKITDAESEADEIIRKAKEEADYTVGCRKEGGARI